MELSEWWYSLLPRRRKIPDNRNDNDNGNDNGINVSNTDCGENEVENFWEKHRKGWKHLGNRRNEE